MNKIKFALISFVLGISLFLSIALASTPHLISLQGYATDNADKPLVTGNIAVRIYDAATGGNLIYDSGSDFNNAVQKGIFDVLLGSVTPLNLDNTLKYYMEVDINGQEVIGDATTGRQAFWPGSGQHTASATYTAGSGLSLAGTTFAVKTCSDNQILRYSSSDWTCSSGLATCSDCSSVFATVGHTHSFAQITGTLNPSVISPQGSGSGLNADLLDGQHASSFALSGHTHSTLAAADGNPTDAVDADNNGNVFIMHGNLLVDTGGTLFVDSEDNRVGIDVGGIPSYTLQVAGSAKVDTLEVAGAANAQQLCIAGNCRSNWQHTVSVYQNYASTTGGYMTPSLNCPTGYQRVGCSGAIVDYINGHYGGSYPYYDGCRSDCYSSVATICYVYIYCIQW